MFPIKYFVMLLASFSLISLSNSAEAATTDEDIEIDLLADDEDDDKDKEDSSKGDDATKEEDNDKDDASKDDEATKEDDEDEDDDSERGEREVSKEITESTITGPDGTEIKSLFELNEDVAEELEDAEESDATLEEVLKDKDDVTSYYAETYMMINAFDGSSDKAADNDLVGLTAEINEEGDNFQVYSGQYDESIQKVQPYAYADEDTLLVQENGTWNDYTGQAPADEVYYGSYSNVYDAFMESEDVIDVLEDDDNYYLINVGQEEILHETFGTLYQVEFTNADPESQNNAVVAIVDKETNEIDKLSYLSNAKGLTDGQELYIEIAAEFDDYGEYDEGVTEVKEGDTVDIETSRNSTNDSSLDASSAGDSEGETIKGEDAEINALEEDNQGLAAALEGAEDTDVGLEEVLKDKEKIVSYYAETDALVKVVPNDDSVEGEENSLTLTAEVMEQADAGELEVYTEQTTNGGQAVPVVYANDDVYYHFENGKWTDESDEGDVESVYNGTYSKMYDTFMDNEDLITVKQDDDNYYLYNISNDMKVHDTFGQIFGAEFTNADESKQVNGIIAIVNKDSKELDQVAYISNAPAKGEEANIHIEMALKYDNYGEFDDGVTVPDEIYE